MQYTALLEYCSVISCKNTFIKQIRASCRAQKDIMIDLSYDMDSSFVYWTMFLNKPFSGNSRPFGTPAFSKFPSALELWNCRIQLSLQISLEEDLSKLKLQTQIDHRAEQTQPGKPLMQAKVTLVYLNSARRGNPQESPLLSQEVEWGRQRAAQRSCREFAN
ncbi:hypothetical protein J6590_086503 [Homalodisca vitripennis]|nr:hypothetical protein J6590_086503 [Homalodisca vitripennis]